VRTQQERFVIVKKRSCIITLTIRLTRVKSDPLPSQLIRLSSSVQKWTIKRTLHENVGNCIPIRLSKATKRNTLFRDHSASFIFYGSLFRKCNLVDHYRADVVTKDTSKTLLVSLAVLLRHFLAENSSNLLGSKAASANLGNLNLGCGRKEHKLRALYVGVCCVSAVHVHRCVLARSNASHF
jgi:hypothetical protein